MPARDAKAQQTRKVSQTAAGTANQAGGGLQAGRRGVHGQKQPGRAAAEAESEDLFTAAALVSLSKEHTNQLRQAFDMFDSAGTGRIKVSEVKVAVYALGYPVSSPELDQVLRAAGVSTSLGPNGEEPTMDFNDFYNVLLRKMTEKESRTESVRAFRQIDQDDKGYISLEDLREMVDSLHMELTDDELVEMVLFAQSSTAGVPGATGAGGAGGNGGAAAEFGAKESMAVNEDQFLKLLKRANIF